MVVQPTNRNINTTLYATANDSREAEEKLLSEMKQEKTNPNKDTYIMSEEAKQSATADEALPDEEAESGNPKYELSDSDRDKLHKHYSKLSESWVMKDMLIKTVESSKSQAEAEAERLKEQSETMQKCMKISRNMSKGLRVPPADEGYLMKKNISMYQMAVTARALVEKLNEEAESELDKDDLKEMRGDVALPQAEEKNPADDVPNREKYAEIPMMEAIGKVLDGDAPLSSLEGIIPLKSFEGMRQSSSSGGAVAQGGTSGFASSGSASSSGGAVSSGSVSTGDIPV